MTTRFPSLGSLRAMAASRRRGHLAGSSWLVVGDRDLDRMASDLLFLSQAKVPGPPRDSERSEPEVTRPIDLHHRRVRGGRPGGHTATAPHARAS